MVGDRGAEVAEAGGQDCNVWSPSEGVYSLENVLLWKAPNGSERTWCKQQ